MPPAVRSITERLLSKIAFAPSGCWLWTAATNNGYALLWDNERQKLVKAHRVAYELFIGAIPDGLELDHLCRVRHCVNPEHLEPVTRSENMLRSPLIRRERCSKGHPLTEGNVIYKKDGKRDRCRTCAAAYMRGYRARRKREAISAT
jgi:HNH endonuclease